MSILIVMVLLLLMNLRIYTLVILVILHIRWFKRRKIDTWNQVHWKPLFANLLLWLRHVSFRLLVVRHRNTSSDIKQRSQSCGIHAVSLVIVFSHVVNSSIVIDLANLRYRNEDLLVWLVSIHLIDLIHVICIRFFGLVGWDLSRVEWLKFEWAEVHWCHLKLLRYKLLFHLVWILDAAFIHFLDWPWCQSRSTYL